MQQQTMASSTHLISRARRPWSADLCNCCVTGPGVCCYALCCGPCAAGDVASAAGRDYCVSCFIVPFLVPCYAPCHIACSDRSALAARFGIEDDVAGCAACVIFSCVPFGGVCILAQELNEIKLANVQGGLIITQTTTPAAANSYSAQAPAPESYQADAPSGFSKA